MKVQGTGMRPGVVTTTSTSTIPAANSNNSNKNATPSEKLVSTARST